MERIIPLTQSCFIQCSSSSHGLKSLFTFWYTHPPWKVTKSGVGVCGKTLLVFTVSLMRSEGNPWNMR